MTRKYDKECKLQTVRLIQKEGKTVAQVARDAALRQLLTFFARYKRNPLACSPSRLALS